MPPKRSDRLGEQLIGKVPTVEFDLLVVVFYFGFGWARCAMVDSKVSLTQNQIVRILIHIWPPIMQLAKKD